MSDTANVTYAKPKVGGAIHSAPLGTELPVTATEKLDAQFKSLGFVSEDGVTNEDTRESEEIKAWGGQTVAAPQTAKSDKFKYKLLEILNVEVLKEVYGSTNVEGTLETGIKIKSNAKELEEHALVIDMILKGEILKRIVIPKAKVKEVAEIAYKDNEAAGYDTTIQAFPDADENTHYEYIQKSTP